MSDSGLQLAGGWRERESGNFDESVGSGVREPLHFSGIDLGELARRDKMSYGKLGHLTDQRKPRAGVGQTTEQVFNNLIDVILNAKKDIIRINGLDDYETAKQYAEKRNLRISEKETDINHDGVNDVILYNKAGNPVIVNGYKLVPSQQPVRKLYQAARRMDTLTKPEDGMRGFVKQLYGASDEWDDETGEREVRYSNDNPPAELAKLHGRGWVLPAAPRKKLSAFQQVMKIIKDRYAIYKKEVMDASDKKWVNGILPRFKLFSLVYLDSIEREAWHNIGNAIQQQIYEESGGDPFVAYELFKKHKESNKKEFREWLTDNIPKIRADVSTIIDSVMTNLFVGIGFTAEAFEGMVTDTQIRQMNDGEKARFEDLKRGLKRQFDSAADRCKNIIIEAIFSPPRDA